MAPRITWTAVEILAVAGTAVTVGTPDEYGGMATLVLEPPHVQPHFLPAVGSNARVLKVDNVPFLYPDIIGEDAITAREIIADAITALLIQGATIIAGNPAGNHVNIKSDGVRVYAFDADVGQFEAIRMGTAGDDFWAVTTAGGVSVASISSAGAAQFSALSSTSWPQIGAGDWTGVGGSLDEVLDRRPRGIVAYMVLDAAGPGTTTATGWREFSADLHPGRVYRLSGAVPMKSTVAGDVAQVQIRYTSAALGTTPAQPSLASPAFHRSTREVNTSPGQVPLGWVFTPGGAAQSYRFLICYSRISGTGTINAEVSAAEPAVLALEDLGPAPAFRATVANDGGGGVVTPAPAARTLTVDGLWSNTYFANGNQDSGSTSLRQGFGVSGDRKSMLGFRQLTELVGATVQSATLRLNAKAWKVPPAGVAAVGFHTKLTQPTESLVGMTGITADVFRAAAWSGLGAGFIDLTAYAPQEWATGAKRGIYLGVAQGVADASDALVGAFNGPLDSDPNVRPQLTITYTI